jgi:peptidoglycan hydrolase-like protein with peptidoglycan-binding domain
VAAAFTQGAGGRFTGSTGSGVQVPPAISSAFAAEGGDLSYSPKTNRGTGYGRKGGSSLVKLLQQALNRAGFKDSHGRPLAVDGKLGPLTTSATKAAQIRLGIKPADGKVSPEFLTRVLGMPAGPAAKPVRARDKMRSHQPSKRPTKKPPKAPVAAKPTTHVGTTHMHAV